MAIPEPFATAFTITSTIIINIASDIVEHNAKVLEGTLAGRVLKSAGLIEPNFNARLRDTLKKALELYFEANQQYNLSGIDTFFRDPAVPKQIGDYFPHPHPIHQQQEQQAPHRHPGTDTVTEILI